MQGVVPGAQNTRRITGLCRLFSLYLTPPCSIFFLEGDLYTPHPMLPWHLPSG